MPFSESGIAVLVPGSPLTYAGHVPEPENNAPASLEDDVWRFAGTGLRQTYARNAVIFSDEDPADFIYRLERGAARLYRINWAGRRQIVDFLIPGDLFGFSDEESHGLTAEALGDIVVHRYLRRDIETLSEKIPAVQKQLMKELRKRMSSMQAHLTVLGCQHVNERVASFLLMFADRTKSATQGKTRSNAHLTLPMNRQDIADYLGLTIESVCRSISELKRQDIISLPGTHQLILKNLDVLHALAEGDSESVQPRRALRGATR